MAKFGSVRKTVREAVATTIEAGLSGAAKVLAYNPVSPRGISPLVSVFTDPHRLPTGMDKSANFPCGIVVSIWVRRDDDAGGAQDAADAVDTLAGQLVDVMEEVYNARETQDPDAFYEIIDGKPYMIEFHYFDVDWWLE